MDEQALLKAARALSSLEERAAYLQAACKGDVALRKRIEEKLKAGSTDHRPLSSQKISRAETASMAGTPGKPESPGSHSDALTGTFGRYKILRLLGKGGMGSVYLAKDTALDRDVALKIPTLSSGDDRNEVVERFFREARAAGNLHHPNICPVFDVGEIDGRHYLTMRFIEGRPLSKFISKDKPQNFRNVAVVIRKLASALAEAHKAGIVHRDLKPANVMMDAKGEPVVMDFGLARQMHGKKELQLTQSGMIVGTPAYMSPEQISGVAERIDARTDVWSLGVMLFELLTGHLPYDGNVLQVIGAIQHTDPPPPSLYRKDVPPKLEAICQKMLSRDAVSRYQSMDEVSADLTAFLKDPTGGAGSTSDAQLATLPGLTMAPRPESPSRPSQPTTFEMTPLTLAPTPPPPPVSTGQQPPPFVARRRKRKGLPPWLAIGATSAAGIGIVIAVLFWLMKSDEVAVKFELDRSLAGEKLRLIVDDRLYDVTEAGRTVNVKPGKHELEVQRGLQRFRTSSFLVVLGSQPTLRIGATGSESLSVTESSPGKPSRDLNLPLLAADAPPPKIVQTVNPKPDSGESRPSGNGNATPVSTSSLLADGKTAGDLWDANGLKMKFCWCPPGNFIMGSPSNEPERQSQADEGNEDQVPVVVSRGFWIGQFELTQEEWQLVKGTTISQLRDRFIAALPLYGEGPKYPVYYVSHADATDFCVRLTQRERSAGRLPSDWEYRLPTEAQWEYACRAGTTTATAFGDRLSSRQANFSGDLPYNFAAKGPYLKQTAEVGLYPANPWNIHDMHGNVWELCRDNFQNRLTGGRDPEVTANTGKWVHRGGGWRGGGRRNRSAVRAGVTDTEVSFDLGFRVALVRTN